MTWRTYAYRWGEIIYHGENFFAVETFAEIIIQIGRLRFDGVIVKRKLPPRFCGVCTQTRVKHRFTNNARRMSLCLTQTESNLCLFGADVSAITEAVRCSAIVTTVVASSVYVKLLSTRVRWRPTIKRSWCGGKWTARTSRFLGNNLIFHYRIVGDC